MKKIWVWIVVGGVVLLYFQSKARKNRQGGANLPGQNYDARNGLMKVLQ